MATSDQIEGLLARKDVRSADRANLQAMLRRLRQNEALSYQERQNLFAYFNRYAVMTIDTQRP